MNVTHHSNTKQNDTKHEVTEYKDTHHEIKHSNTLQKTAECLKYAICCVVSLSVVS
jgi:hypothetical protein